MKINYKLGKPFSSYEVCTDLSKTNKEMWNAALRDPVYLIAVAITLAFFISSLYGYFTM